MAKQNDTDFFSVSNNNCDAIEVCQCEDEDDVSKMIMSSNTVCTDGWNSNIVISRKDYPKYRSPNGRCTHRKRRVLHKNGRSTDIIRLNVPLRYMRYLRDLGNTMVNSRWRWITLILVLTFGVLWVLFAWFWMLIASVHGDTDLPYRNDSCTVGNEGFAGFLLMSIETQTTIGYGSRYPTENCPEGVFMLCLQMILGIGVEGAILGIIYVKMTRPCSRDSLKLFSRIAVICQRDGDLCLMFRVGDKRRAHIVGTQLRAYVMETRHTEQGEYLENYQTPLKLEPYGLLLWPLTVVHKINSASPMYDMSAKDLLLKKFEIVVVMVGSSDSTGQLTQSRTSYLSSEIYWGHRFKPCTRYDEDRHGYTVHEDLFNAIEQVDTPLCSAQRLEEVLQDIRHQSNAIVTSALPVLPIDTSMSPLAASTCPTTIPLELVTETDV